MRSEASSFVLCIILILYTPIMTYAQEDGSKEIALGRKVAEQVEGPGKGYRSGDNSRLNDLDPL